MEQYILNEEKKGNSIFKNPKNDLTEWSKKDLMDMLTHMEVEMNSMEIALSVLKSKKSKEAQNIKYNFVALLNDSKFCATLADEDTDFKEVKSDLFDVKKDLRKLTSSKNNLMTKTKSIINALSLQYLHSGNLLSQQQGKWVTLQQQVKKMQQQHNTQNQNLLDQLTKLLEEKQSLLDKLGGMEDQLEELDTYKKIAYLLATEKKNLSTSMASIVSLVSDLEKEIEVLKEANGKLSQQIEELEESKKCQQNTEEQMRTYNHAFEDRLRVKDDEIIELRRQLNSIKLKSSFHSDNSSSSQSSIISSIQTQSEVLTSNKSSHPTEQISTKSHTQSAKGVEMVSKSLDTTHSLPTMLHKTPETLRRPQKRESEPDESAKLQIFAPEMAGLQELLNCVDSKASSTCSSLSSSPRASPVPSSFKNSPKEPKNPLLETLQCIICNNDAEALKLLMTHTPSDQLNHILPNRCRPVHFAVECSALETLEVMLKEGWSGDEQDGDLTTPLIIAASEGNTACTSMLLEHGCSFQLANHIGMTPLHSAASNGHIDCCLLLLAAGAAIDAVNINSWTPLHTCIFSDHHDCLRQMLKFSHKDTAKDAIYRESVKKAISMEDKDGCSLVHLAISKDDKKFLQALLAFSDGALDLQKKDKWNRSPIQIASPACLRLLQNPSQEVTCSVTINMNLKSSNQCMPITTTIVNSGFYKVDLSNNNNYPSTLSTEALIGSLQLQKNTEWNELEEQLASIFLSHISQVSTGIRSAKITNLSTSNDTNSFSLGLSIKSVKYYSIGRYHWFPGTYADKLPIELINSQETKNISIKLADDNSLDNLSYNTLIPTFILQNYLRVIQQYKMVVFSGSGGTGKSHLVHQLVAFMQSQSTPGSCKVTINKVEESHTTQHIINTIINSGCLVASSQAASSQQSLVCVLHGISCSQFQAVFSHVTSCLEHKGPSHLITLNTGEHSGSFYLHPNSYIICTINASRLIGLDMSIQQKFKWVTLKKDQDPCRYLLQRHLSRRMLHEYAGVLPSQDTNVFKAVEWLVLVWQRLNEGVAKLGLVDVSIGPCYFIHCPIRKNNYKNILRWLMAMWNKSIVPLISNAIDKTSFTSLKTPQNDTKMLSTALYVLIQRAILPDCPLPSPEKERFLSCFKGNSQKKDSKLSLELKKWQIKNSVNTNNSIPNASFDRRRKALPSETLSNSISQDSLKSMYTSLQDLSQSQFSLSASHSKSFTKVPPTIPSSSSNPWIAYLTLPGTDDVIVSQPKK